MLLLLIIGSTLGDLCNDSRGDGGGGDGGNDDEDDATMVRKALLEEENALQFCAAVYSGLKLCTSAHERSMILRAFEKCDVVVVVVASIDSNIR